jgi:predicted dehydrogenase
MPGEGISVALIGTGFMGRAHSHAYRSVASMFPECPRPRLKLICGRDRERAEALAARFGWEEVSTSWEEAVGRAGVDLVDVSVPGALHAPVSIAAARAGKHVLCEKPLANSLEEARAMLAAVREAGVLHMVQFNYRRVPAVALARQMLDEGQLGTLYHYRARYFQEWGVYPQVRAPWKLDREQAGSGALGDLGSHMIDLCRYLAGEIREVTGMTETFVKERPGSAGVPPAGPAAKADAGGTPALPGAVIKVTVDDAALFLARLENGALASFETTRLAAGRKNHNFFEINGSRGSLYFDLERLNELNFYSLDDPPGRRGFRNLLATSPQHPYAASWWPDGHLLGWEHSHTHAIRDFLMAIGQGQLPRPNFEDGVKCQAVLDAVARSVASRRWEAVE